MSNNNKEWTGQKEVKSVLDRGICESSFCIVAWLSKLSADHCTGDV